MKTRKLAILLMAAMLCSVGAGLVREDSVSGKTVDESRITYPKSRTIWSCDEGIVRKRMYRNFVLLNMIKTGRN